MTTFAPRTADEVTDAIRWAVSAGEALEVLGGGSRRTLGRAVDLPHVLDLSALAGIVSYEPEELVLTARAGTPMHVIESALAERSQCFAFEPPELSVLLAASGAARVGDANCPGAASGSVEAGVLTAGLPGARRLSALRRSTLGGVIATGLSGPRRFKAGAARDHVLGVAAVSGRGEAFVGGGKVVKNVTGYDLPKLMTGSYGTLAVFTEITLKVLPAPERASTVLVSGLSAADAVRAMTGALQSSLDVSGACHLPAAIGMAGKAVGVSLTAFRLEGFARSVEARVQSLRERLGSLGSIDALEDEECRAFWARVRDVQPFVDAAAGQVWRISVPPAHGAEVVERLERALPGSQMFLDWGGGLIWLATGDGAEVPTDAVRVREALAPCGGHATLIRAPAAARASVDVFHPQSAAVAALSKRVKAQFDPTGVLNPGRMYAGV